MYAELRGKAAQLDGEPRWRFRPVGKVSPLTGECGELDEQRAAGSSGVLAAKSRDWRASLRWTTGNSVRAFLPLYPMTCDRRFARFRGRDRRMFNPAYELCTEKIAHCAIDRARLSSEPGVRVNRREENPDFATYQSAIHGCSRQTLSPVPKYTSANHRE
jgi:hypothetical protein